MPPMATRPMAVPPIRGVTPELPVSARLVLGPGVTTGVEGAGSVRVWVVSARAALRVRQSRTPAKRCSKPAGPRTVKS